MIDIQLLRMMRTRVDFNKVLPAVKKGTVDSSTMAVIEGLKRYYGKFPDENQVDFAVFLPFFERNVKPNLDDEDREKFRNIIGNMAKHYPSDTVRAGMLQQLHEASLVHKSQEIVTQYVAGEDVEPAIAISDALDVYKRNVKAIDTPEVSENIDELLDNVANEHGIHWRLECLNKSMRPLRGGDFIIVAARPDQGKTSFLCSELTFMAPQLEEGRPVLWFNNEGQGYSIRPRLMQAALNCTLAELVEKKEAGTLYTEYCDAMGGENRVRIMDIHGYNTGQVEELIERVEPSIILYDMIDNVRGFQSAARTDLQLEFMYQWAREKAVQYDAAALATSQISQEGACLRFPTLGMLKDSKTGKQGACDAQLMIGSLEDQPEYANTRWLSLPKNKLRRLKSPTLQEQVTFDRERARYNMIKTDTGDT